MAELLSSIEQLAKFSYYACKFVRDGNLIGIGNWKIPHSRIASELDLGEEISGNDLSRRKLADAGALIAVSFIPPIIRLEGESSSCEYPPGHTTRQETAQVVAAITGAEVQIQI